MNNKATLFKTQYAVLADMLTSSNQDVREFGFHMLMNTYDISNTNIIIQYNLYHTLKKVYFDYYRWNRYVTYEKYKNEEIIIKYIKEYFGQMPKRLIKAIKDTKNQKKLKKLHNTLIEIVELMKKENLKTHEYHDNLFEY